MDNKSFNNDIHLTPEELVAYNQGNLSNSEMRRLELHLVNCDLCNEAIDGITGIEEAALNKNLAEIRSKTEIKSKVKITISGKQYMAMAASIVLIAVVSALFIFIPKEEESIIAEKAPIKEEPIVVEDSSMKNRPQDSLNMIALREDSLLALAEAPAPSPAVRRVRAIKVTQEEAKGLSVTDRPDAMAELTNINDTTFLVDNISLELDVEATGDEESATRSKKTSAPVAGAETPTLQEAITSNAKSGNVSDYKAAEPDKGQRSFERYLKRNLNYPAAAKENKIEGKVVLELSINSFGSITNINVVQTLGYGCDDEAIRLIREGPNWVPATINNTATDGKVVIVVPFNL